MDAFMSVKGLSSWVEVGLQCSVELADDRSFQAADDFLFRFAFLGSSFEVALGGFVPSESVDDDEVNGAVGVAVAAAV